MPRPQLTSPDRNRSCLRTTCRPPSLRAVYADAGVGLLHSRAPGAPPPLSPRRPEPRCPGGPLRGQGHRLANRLQDASTIEACWRTPTCPQSLLAERRRRVHGTGASQSRPCSSHSCSYRPWSLRRASRVWVLRRSGRSMPLSCCSKVRAFPWLAGKTYTCGSRPTGSRYRTGVGEAGVREVDFAPMPAPPSKKAPWEDDPKPRPIDLSWSIRASASTGDLDLRLDAISGHVVAMSQSSR